MGDGLLGLLIIWIVCLSLLAITGTTPEDARHKAQLHAERAATIKACNDKGGTVSVLHVGYDELLQCTLPEPVPAKG